MLGKKDLKTHIFSERQTIGSKNLQFLAAYLLSLKNSKVINCFKKIGQKFQVQAIEVLRSL